MLAASIILMATFLCERISQPLYTSPDSPRPIIFYSLYLPFSIEPILRALVYKYGAPNLSFTFYFFITMLLGVF
jgi:hypothetical protein